MREVFGDYWDYAAPVKCITTNGDVNRHGRAVMGGGGIADQAATRLHDVQVALAGVLLHAEGNHVADLGLWEGVRYLSFPVKHHWREQADLELIDRSCRELARMATSFYRVLLPRPGCGNGGLDWAVVKGVCAPLLPDNVLVIDRRP